MEELRKFDIWVNVLRLEWDARGQEEQLKRWLKERNDARSHWDRNRVSRKVNDIEKKVPLNEEEIAWFENFEVVVEIMVKLALPTSLSDELLGEFWHHVDSDFQLLARVSRLHLSDPWLDKLREEYKAGRFPRGVL